MFGFGTLFLAVIAVAAYLTARWPWLRAMKRYCIETGSSITFALLALVPWAGPTLFCRLMSTGAVAHANGHSSGRSVAGHKGVQPHKGSVAALVLDLRTTHAQKESVVGDDRGTQLVAVHVANHGRHSVTLSETAKQFGVKKLSPGDIVLWTPLEKPRPGTIPLSTHRPNAPISGEITEKLNSPPQKAPGWRRRHIAGSSRGYASRGGQGGGIY